jgi:phage terminase large subunit
MPYFKHVVIPSTYIDNPRLPEAEMSKILWKKDKPQFENWWRVYGLGELGTFEGVVFQNWEYGDFPGDMPYKFCLDFGFSPSPDAMVKVAIDQKAKKIYLDEQFYNYNQKPEDLRQAIAEKVLRGEQIIADSADKRMIAWLQGWFRINAVRKVGEVKEWLRLMQDYQIIVTETSKNLADELNNYVFLDEKDGIPIDDFNHLIDPARYGFMEKFSGQIYTRAI